MKKIYPNYSIHELNYINFIFDEDFNDNNDSQNIFYSILKIINIKIIDFSGEIIDPDYNLEIKYKNDPDNEYENEYNNLNSKTTGLKKTKRFRLS